MVIATPRRTHREALLEAAKELLRERDYGTITARDLVAASSTNLGSIGYHFGSKQALLNEAIGEALEDWTEAIAEAIHDDADAPPLARMASSWRRVHDRFDEIRPYFMAFIEAVARSARSPSLAGRLAEHYERQRDRVARMLGEALGDALGEREAHDFASCVIALTDGLMLQAFVDPAHRPSPRELGAAARKAFATAAR
jgi:AcrR family transcriptional regulator